MTSAARLLDEATQRLAVAGIESPRADAELLLTWVLDTSRASLPMVREVRTDDSTAFERAVDRRACREPLQHITGRAAFRRLDLRVGPGVFIPRPETEVLAGVAVAELQRLTADGSSPLAVDLCTGSGAIAVSMATEVPQCRVVAVELSPEAAAYAERNSAGVDRVEVRCGDIAAAADDLAGEAAVVTANPPYIPLEAYESVAVEARDFDPPLALWSGPDGLDMIRTVADVAARLLVDGGLVLCEHADVQGDSAPRIFAATGAFTDVRDCLDLAARPRFVCARRAPRSSGSAGTITA